MAGQFTRYNVYWRERPDTAPLYLPEPERVNFSGSALGFSKGEFAVQFGVNATVPTFSKGNVIHIYEEVAGVERHVHTGVLKSYSLECQAVDAGCGLPGYEFYTINGNEITAELMDMLEHAYAEDTAESALSLDIAEFAHQVITLNHIAPTAARYAPFAHTFPVTSNFTPTGIVYEADVSELSLIDIMEDIVDFGIWNGVFLCIQCDIPDPKATPMQVNFATRPSILQPAYLSRSNGTITAQIDEESYVDSRQRVIAIGEDDLGNPLVEVNEFLDPLNSLNNAEVLVNGGNNDTAAELQDLAISNLGAHVARFYNFVTLNRDGTNEVYDSWGVCDRLRLETCNRGDVEAFVSGVFTDWELATGVPVHDVELCTLGGI